VDAEAVFRRRLRQLIQRKYKSVDRFWLETGWSKGHMSHILRGTRSPSLATIAKLAKTLDVEVVEFFLPDKTTKS
jgi:transcriptional regulator with XRE-family HTH domain